MNKFLFTGHPLWQALAPMLNRTTNIEQQSDQQLLHTLLRSERQAAAIASEFSIEKIANAKRRELGLTQAAYDRLMAGIELGRRIHEAKARYDLPTIISSSTCAIEFCRIHFARLISDGLQEQFHVVTLNTKNHVIDSHQITVGTLDASLVHPREVFRPAVRDAASSIILAHNHPSGDPTPSKEDLNVTKRLEEAGQLVGINVLDHIILGKNGVVSIREHRF